MVLNTRYSFSEGVIPAIQPFFSSCGTLQSKVRSKINPLHTFLCKTSISVFRSIECLFFIYSSELEKGCDETMVIKYEELST